MDSGNMLSPRVLLCQDHCCAVFDVLVASEDTIIYHGDAVAVIFILKHLANVELNSFEAVAAKKDWLKDVSLAVDQIQAVLVTQRIRKRNRIISSKAAIKCLGTVVDASSNYSMFAIRRQYDLGKDDAQ